MRKLVGIVVATGALAAIPATSAIGAQSSGSLSAGCHPSYKGVCLKTGIGDYDCGGGSGNGPNYVWKRNFRVVGPDVFRLDADYDGFDCEPY